MARRQVAHNSKYSNALAERIFRLMEEGLYITQIAAQLAMHPSTIYRWVRNREEFGLRYHLAYVTGWHQRLEKALIRLEDDSRDKGRMASSTVQRDTNNAKMIAQIAAMTCPKEFRPKDTGVDVNVTVKRIVVVEKFDGAKIKRFQRN